MRTLLDAGADKDLALSDGWTLSCDRQEHDAIARALLGAGADKDLALSDGWTPLLVAARQGHDAIARALLDADADKDPR